MCCIVNNRNNGKIQSQGPVNGCMLQRLWEFQTTTKYVLVQHFCPTFLSNNFEYGSVSIFTYILLKIACINDKVLCQE